MQMSEAKTRTPTALPSAINSHPQAYADEIAAWAAREIERIAAWRARSVAAIDVAAATCTGMIEKLAKQRAEASVGVLAPHLTLRITLAEIAAELQSLPESDAARWGKIASLCAERRRLLNAFKSDKIRIPTPSVVAEWAELPSFDAVFKVGPDGDEAPPAAMQAAFTRKTGEGPVLPLACGGNWGLPVLPSLHEGYVARVHKLVLDCVKPNVFAPLNDDEVIVGLHEVAPIQIWDLRACKAVRHFEDKVSQCFALAKLPGGSVAATCWRDGYTVSIYDTATGKLVQTLPRIRSIAFGLVASEDHIIAATFHDQTLRVFQLSTSTGKYVDKSSFDLSATPRGAMTVLSESTVAICMDAPPAVEVWDWQQGKRLHVLRMPGNAVRAVARFGDGRLVVGGFDSQIYIGDPSKWQAADILPNNSSVTAVLTTQDGAIVTTDVAGTIRVWKGALDCRYPGALGSRERYYGVGLAIVGSRIVAVASDAGVLVIQSVPA